jgi:signal transduction histidine kinase
VSHGLIFALPRSRTAPEQLDVALQETVHSVPRFFRTSAIALLVAISYYAGSQIGFLLTPAHSPIAIFWPPNAILLAAFLLTPLRIWWVLLLAVLPVHLLIQLSAGIPLLSSLGWFVGNTGEALMGAACIHYFKKERPLFESVQGIVVFLAFGVLLATLVTSFVDAASTVLTGLGSNYWTMWTLRLTSNIVANLVIVPVIVIIGVKGISLFRSVNRARYFEAGVLAVGILVVSLLVFSRENGTGSIPVFIYAPLPLLLWAALRFGAGGLSASMLVVALISAWNAMHGRGLFGNLPVADHVLSLHILLTAFALPLMLTAALIAERRRSDETLRGTRVRFVDAQERERHRIARELHDDIVQQLTLAGLGVDELRSGANASAKTALGKLHDQISLVSKSTRDLSHNLYPFAVEYLGLAGALKKLCRETGAKSGLTISFSENEAPSCLPSDISCCLFRIAQEALQNIVKHSHAGAASVALKEYGGYVLLRIVDDGIGITPEQLCVGGMGLACMRERAWALDGTCTVTSGPQKGTIVETSLPLRQTPQLDA